MAFEKSCIPPPPVTFFPEEARIAVAIGGIQSLAVPAQMYNLLPFLCTHRIGTEASANPVRRVEINRFICAVDISNILHLVPNQTKLRMGAEENSQTLHSSEYILFERW
ncbi:hypothetical protein [Escherichia coli]|uniref:hypothetical protein n=1 Tax=Escherichia coli TaxID=562 RepID=UPI002FD24F7B